MNDIEILTIGMVIGMAFMYLVMKRLASRTKKSKIEQIIDIIRQKPSDKLPTNEQKADVERKHDKDKW